MNELRRIVDAVDVAESAELSVRGQLVLATVVDVVGSAYRRPAARMLILPDGDRVGSISGGCLERDLCRTAYDLTTRGPKLVSFDTRQNATDFQPRYNLGCHGIIYILLERVTGGANCPVDILRTVLVANQPQTIATVYQSDVPDQAVVGHRLRCVGDILPPEQCCESEQCREFSVTWDEVTTDRPTCCELVFSSGSVRMLIEEISPPKPIWILGAGDDAQPLAEMAWQLGWDVTVADDRASRLTAARFPHARRVCQSWNELDAGLQPTAETCAVLLTHSFEADMLLLPQLLATAITYIGVLGPKSRTGKVMQELHTSGLLPAPETLDRLHTPVGLDLGAKSAAEIAIAVLGEIIAVTNQRSGGRLQQRQGPIHEPVRHVLIDVSRAATAAAPQ